MENTKNTFFCPEIHSSTAFFITLLILSSTHARLLPPEGSNSKGIGIYTEAIDIVDENYGHMGIRDLMIGSKPPVCEWMKYCRKCGKCEAIQIPLVGPSTSSNTTTRRDDISNYKPLCWKCKCGDFTFNP